MKQDNGREKSVSKEIIKVLVYFSLFHYAPSNAQIRTFLPIKVSKLGLNESLVRLISKKKLLSMDLGMPLGSIYTMGGHSIFLKKRIVRKAQTEEKIKALKRYSQILYASPWIKMVGISGSCAMENAKARDDVDFFIITAKNRLWVARIWAIMAAKLLGVHRGRKDKHVSGKACLNMFFDELDIMIPEDKQNLYTAHEVVQMIRIDMREGAYYHRLFIQSNSWITSYFPNFSMPRGQKDTEPIYSKKNLSPGILGGLLEGAAKLVQKSIMSRHITHETISETQLWFFPKDFSKKIARHSGEVSNRFQ